MPVITQRQDLDPGTNVLGRDQRVADVIEVILEPLVIRALFIEPTAC